MNMRTWNVKLMATDQRPEITVEGVQQEDATRLLRGLMEGPGSAGYALVEAASQRAAERTEAAALVA